MDPVWGDLEPRGNPYAIDGDIDAEDNGKRTPFEPELLTLTVNEKRYPVAYDLNETLQL